MIHPNEMPAIMDAADEYEEAHRRNNGYRELAVTSIATSFYCPRGYGECEDARACVYPGRCSYTCELAVTLARAVVFESDDVSRETKLEIGLREAAERLRRGDHGGALSVIEYSLRK